MDRNFLGYIQIFTTEFFFHFRIDIDPPAMRAFLAMAINLIKQHNWRKDQDVLLLFFFPVSCLKTRMAIGST